MLNYIWAALIGFSLLFALISDAGDFKADTYRNGRPFPVVVAFAPGYDPNVASQAVTVRVDSAQASAFYGQRISTAAYPGTLVPSGGGRQLPSAPRSTLPQPLATMR